MVETFVASWRSVTQRRSADPDGAPFQLYHVESAPCRTFLETRQRTSWFVETLELHRAPPLELALVLGGPVGPQLRFAGRQVDPIIREHRTLSLFLWEMV